MHAYRSHTCGELRKEHVGQTVRLSGWVNRRRDHGGLLFIDLRDHYGITQCVVEPDEAAFAAADEARSEWVLTLTGRVVARTADTVNKDLPTGEVEMRIESVAVQGRAAELPVPVFGDLDYPEETRLKYRFLDLRREKLHRNITLRSKVISSIRRRMIEQGFTEFQTPILTASSPEGARDFLVPSRLHAGKFYALPQAPQQFKQLIMVAGFDRYFQIAPCFRDEDARADRSPGEFYQLDLEMSFVTQDDVFAAVEPVLNGVFEEFREGRTVSGVPFPRIPYDVSMLKYGVDKPDLRNPIEIVDVSDVFAQDDVAFKAFKDKTVRAIPAPGAASQPRSFFDKLNDWARADMKAPGLGYVVFEDDGGKLVGKGPIAKFIPEAAQAALVAKSGVKAGDALFFSADAKADRAAALAGQARIRLGNELNLIDKSKFEFCWIVDFPMYEWNEDEKKIDFSHNPFSMPQFSRELFMSSRTGRQGHDPGPKGLSIRHRVQRHRAVERRDPQPRSRRDAEGVRDRGLCARGDGGQIRRHAERVPLWCTAAWRHRARHRPHRHADRGRGKSARSHHVPDEPAGRRFDDGRPERGVARSAPRASYPRGSARKDRLGFPVVRFGGIYAWHFRVRVDWRAVLHGRGTR